MFGLCEEYVWVKRELHCRKCKKWFVVELPEPWDGDTDAECQECWEEREERRYASAGLAGCLGPLEY